jgi:hypothetical protein
MYMYICIYERIYIYDYIIIYIHYDLSIRCLRLWGGCRGMYLYFIFCFLVMCRMSQETILEEDPLIAAEGCT